MTVVWPTVTTTHWSKSGLASLLDGCSWQWAITKVLGHPDPGGPATWRGTAVHAGIEWHERHRIAGLAPPDAADVIDHAWQVLETEIADGGADAEVWDRHGTSPDELSASVAAALSHWWEYPLKDTGMSLRDTVMQWTPIAAEPGFDTPVGTSVRRQRGFIDTVYWTGEHWVVVDVKTAGKLSYWGSAEGHEREGAVYIKAAADTPTLPCSGKIVMEWHVCRTASGKTARFEGARRVTFEPEPHHFRWLEDDIRRADRIVDEGLFAKNPAWNLCSPKWCPHWDGCMVEGSLVPENYTALPVA